MNVFSSEFAWLGNPLHLELAEEPQGGPPDELVGVLQVLPVGVADQDHLLHELAVRVRLGADLPEDEEELLDGVVLE